MAASGGFYIPTALNCFPIDAAALGLIFSPPKIPLRDFGRSMRQCDGERGRLLCAAALKGRLLYMEFGQILCGRCSRLGRG